MTGPDPSSTPVPRLTHRNDHRLSHAREYQAAFAAKLRAPAGPLVVFVRPNQRPEPRLGLSVSRRVGPAVVRNRVKRLLREAFRHERHGLPSVEGERYDYVVTVRPHEGLPLVRYRALLREAADHAHRTHLRRIEREQSDHRSDLP